ncbi:hypothetical protein [Enterococcus pallens]|uniref:Peptidase MA-like domain-containing protein n=1 Tax=Enterococcus pallens ATCC BAA-351 TaxID=1158607 RepID=R2SMT8_9ENTE|nr:hypothetical protein [Enterococcus pallens]EOH89559.1 hypothetical protein UAU_04167 [Enterococcus pallens ATCC BAA-351]EOU09382.1 hypothetical protein I588_05273 [Enterococcus pallens ATCC BAA-351]OJG70446.1 hypothetical protein RV10_GL005106 [Enterococcus pallens]
MKKKLIVFILLGLLGISLGVQSVTQAEDVEQVTEPVVEEVVDESIDGEASDSMETGKPKRSLAQSNETRTIELQKFYIETTDGAADSVSVPFPNTNYKLHYSKDGKETFLSEGVTNEKGEILNFKLEGIPSEGAALRVRYYLGNENRGFVQKFNKNHYGFVFTLRLIDHKQTINYINTKARFGNTVDPDSYFYNFQAARINCYFDQAVTEYTEAVKQANQLLPESSRFELKPINMNFEKGKHIGGSAFCRRGYDQSGVSDIVIGNHSTGIYTDYYLKRVVMHEWTHWNMYQATGMPGGVYEDHYSFNPNPQTSYKEGWAIFVADMFRKNYENEKHDKVVQTVEYNRFYGKSVNLTVYHVLYDLLDTGTNDESFSVSQRYLDEELSDQETRQLNLGMLHTAMVESKATTLQGLLNYLENKYVLTASDKEKFAQLLEVNGLSRDGNFTLDGDGNPLAAPMMVPVITEEVDVWENESDDF